MIVVNLGQTRLDWMFWSRKSVNKGRKMWKWSDIAEMDSCGRKMFLFLCGSEAHKVVGHVWNMKLFI